MVHNSGHEQTKVFRIGSEWITPSGNIALPVPLLLKLQRGYFPYLRQLQAVDISQSIFQVTSRNARL